MDKMEKMARERLNQPILTGLEIGRLVGFGFDGRDACLIVDYPYTARRPGRQMHACIEKYTFLDEFEGRDRLEGPDGEVFDDLRWIEGLLTLNGAPKVEAFVVGPPIDPIFA